MLKKLCGTIANVSDSLGEVMAKLGSYKRKVTLTPHKIKHEYVNPDESDLAWDDELYVNGNVFAENRANPVRLQTDSGEFISSERYKSFMKNKLVKELIRTTESEGIDITTAVKILLGVSIATFGMTMFLMLNFLGVV